MVIVGKNINLLIIRYNMRGAGDFMTLFRKWEKLGGRKGKFHKYGESVTSDYKISNLRCHNDDNNHI